MIEKSAAHRGLLRTWEPHRESCNQREKAGAWKRLSFFKVFFIKKVIKNIFGGHFGEKSNSGGKTIRTFNQMIIMIIL